MTKFALLVIFLAVSVYWIYQPFSMNASDEMIDKYRPSLQKKPDLSPKDSIYPKKTLYRDQATAFRLPKAAIFSQ